MTLQLSPDNPGVTAGIIVLSWIITAGIIVLSWIITAGIIVLSCTVTAVLVVLSCIVFTGIFRTVSASCHCPALAGAAGIVIRVGGKNHRSDSEY